MCGEKSLIPALPLHVVGSPPRVRGKGPPQLLRCRVEGITPACAGKSLNRFSNHILVWDHPRVCGEKYSLACCPWPASGSPPRVRGKGADCPADRDPDRITPACAGKRTRQLHRNCAVRDHPRVCGEKVRTDWQCIDIQGSPPRVRGKVDSCAQLWPLHRITPACAGKSRLLLFLHAEPEDHPRVCGEKKKMNMRKDRRMGSPPRVRGKG